MSYYGKFHVILKKENGVWKLLVAYNSSENDTIHDTSYSNTQKAIENYKKSLELNLNNENARMKIKELRKSK